MAESGPVASKGPESWERRKEEAIFLRNQLGHSFRYSLRYSEDGSRNSTQAFLVLLPLIGIIFGWALAAAWSLMTAC